MEWYYVMENEQQGPVDEETFKDLCATGEIKGQTLVWNKTMTDWQPYDQVKPMILKAAQDAARTAQPGVQTEQETPAQSPAQSPGRTGRKLCSECGKGFSDDELVAFQDSLICAGCKPIFLQKMREGVSTGQMVYAGFWIRFVAKFVDGIILMVINTLFTMGIGMFTSSTAGGPDQAAAAMMPGLIIMALQWAVNIFYTVWFVGKYAATPGKMITGLRIVTPNDGKVTYLRAFGRGFAEILSSLIFSIGYIMAAFDSEKRALHDRICATRVVKK